MSLASGIAAQGARELARLPFALLRLPLIGLHRALVLGETVRRGVDRLADQGAALLISRVRGGAAEPAEPAADPVSRAVESLEAPAPVPVERAELPLPDFDHLTAGSLRTRLRRLDLAELLALRAYEQQHARRLPILTLLENRIARLEAEQAGAQVSQPGG